MAGGAEYGQCRRWRVPGRSRDGKGAGGAVVVFSAPCVNVLAQQVDLTHALRR